ncbi:MAG: TetR/AcrR family transcriptional regulator [Planctomycetaceae bacterium]|jgi:AcrR family transcriptional regulator|nr:TetR/AcrR family transcriptional regulator [Planctomycetaceae bacterium]
MADTRELLLDAASRLFAAHGFDKVSTRMIAQEANANLGSIHYHFGSKEALYFETFRVAINADSPLTIEELLAVDPTLLTTPEGKAYAIHRLTYDYYNRHYNIPEKWKRQLILRELYHPSPVYQKLVDEILKIESQRMIDFYFMLAPNASLVDAFVWAHYPDTQATYYLKAEDPIAQYRGQEFMEKLNRNIIKFTTRMMIMSLDLPVPDLLK